MNPKLSILIPSLAHRGQFLERCVLFLKSQIDHLHAQSEVELFLSIDSGEETTGAKRNKLLDMARKVNSEYVAFFDDDDLPGPNYIREQLAVAYSGKDCGSFIGHIYFDRRKDDRPFFHSIKYDHWWDDGNGYYRCPNHLNAIKLKHYDGLLFPDVVFGEDGAMSSAMQKTGRLTSEHEVSEVIYHYFAGKVKDIAWQNRQVERAHQLT